MEKAMKTKNRQYTKPTLHPFPDMDDAHSFSKCDGGSAAATTCAGGSHPGRYCENGGSH
ncbi:MAG: hypothetical protein HQK89_10940 [Nitrospirae bacterium]|nr:hypothetical protein [Nitrospirota bacterium]